MVYLDKEMCYVVKPKPKNIPKITIFMGGIHHPQMVCSLQAAKLEEITSTKSLNGVA